MRFSTTGLAKCRPCSTDCLGAQHDAEDDCYQQHAVDAVVALEPRWTLNSKLSGKNMKTWNENKSKPRLPKKMSSSRW